MTSRISLDNKASPRVLLGIANEAQARLGVDPAPEVRAIRRILVCVDGSEASAECLHYAVAISKSLGSAITLLHVMQPSRERSGLQAPDVLDWEINRQQATAYLERLRSAGSAALQREVSVRLEQGRPVERIAAVARELDADLTVLGGQGELGVAAWDLGSTVLHVLAVARGSVLIARSAAAVAGEVSPKRILVPLDGSLRAESVLPTSVRIAKEHGAALVLVFVVGEPVPTAVLRAPEDLAIARDLARRLEIAAKRYLEELREQLVREGASVRALVLRTTDEKQAVIDLAARDASDLIIVSAHGSTCNAQLRFGGCTAHLLTHARVPVLVLQDLRDSELRGREPSEPAPPLRSGYPESL